MWKFTNKYVPNNTHGKISKFSRNSIALLQNGQLPVYIPEEILQAIFVEDLELPSCVRELKGGMDTLGIPMFGRKFPMLLYLLRPSSIISLSVRHLLFLLKPEFLEEGSNMLIHEKAIYSKFVKYVRDVSSGRTVVTLGNILELRQVCATFG